MELKSITFPGMDEAYLTAPGGYGLGTNNGKEVSDCNAAIANGFYTLSGASLQNPPPGNLRYGSMLVLNRYNSNHITQIAYYRNDMAIRTYYNSEWSAWVNNSPTAFAPSGYGYGDNKKYITASTEAELETILDERLARMIAAGNTYGSEQLTVNSSLLGAYNGTGILHCTHNSGNYAFFVYYGFYPGGSKAQLITKVKYGGKWKPIDKPIPSMELLWTNASPNSAFGEQTLNLDLSGYAFVYIEFLAHCSSGAWRWYRITQTVPVNTDSDWKYYQAAGYSETGSAMAFRAYSLSNNQIRFGKSYYAASYNASTLSESSNLYVPVAIYGIKGVG